MDRIFQHCSLKKSSPYPMTGGRRPMIGVNREDDMQNQIKILNFLSESNNGRCTYAEFKRFDNDPTHHLATFLLDLIFTGKVHDNPGIGEYILTDEGKKYLVTLLTLSDLSKSVSKKSK